MLHCRNCSLQAWHLSFVLSNQSNKQSVFHGSSQHPRVFQYVAKRRNEALRWQQKMNAFTVTEECFYLWGKKTSVIPCTYSKPYRNRASVILNCLKGCCLLSSTQLWRSSAVRDCILMHFWYLHCHFHSG